MKKKVWCKKKNIIQDPQLIQKYNSNRHGVVSVKEIQETGDKIDYILKDKEDIKMETEFKRLKWNLLAKNEYFPVSFKKNQKGYKLCWRQWEANPGSGEKCICNFFLLGQVAMGNLEQVISPLWGPDHIWKS